MRSNLEPLFPAMRMHVDVANTETFDQRRSIMVLKYSKMYFDTLLLSSNAISLDAAISIYLNRLRTPPYTEYSLQMSQILQHFTKQGSNMVKALKMFFDTLFEYNFP